ncbi:MAG: TonB-dependent receptor [Bacteroidota bacterium]
MRKMITLLLGMMLIYSGSFAKQTGANIKGTVNDDKGKPQAAATVLLQKSKDSSLVKTDVTNGDGKYEFINMPAGSYFITVSSVGFTNSTSAVFTTAEGKATDMPLTTLQIASKDLGGVTVKAKKPLVEMRADKMVLNVEASINATGSNAMELLQKSPGVVVDKDDNISVKGKTGVRIYIDGRPSQMDNKDLAAMLRSMNSADIEAIEFITNPSAKYDASGNAGIINIRLKKSKLVGFNGNLSVGMMFGVTPKTMNSLSMNYRTKKANFFGNYSNGFGINQSDFNFHRQQADSIYDTRSKQWNDNANHNFKAGADFFINSKNTFGVIVTGNLSDGKSTSDSKTPISPISTGVLSRTLLAQNTLPATRNNLNYNANYRYADTSGHELNVDVDYGTFRGRTNSFQPNEYLYPNGSVIRTVFKNNTPIDIDIITAKADYEQKLGTGKLGFGAKYSNVKTKNTFDFWDVINGVDKFNTDRSNKFTYKENVNALYVNYNRAFGQKWTLQAGLRMENTQSEGNLTSYKQAKPEDNVKRNYTDFFPSGALSFAANQSNSFNLTYSRRIQRPSYQDLNPFENKLDELTYEKGNAFLRPQYANSFEISHVYKYMLTTTLGFSHVKDLITQLTDTADKTKSYITNRNLANQDIISLNIGSPVPVAKWWNAYLNVNVNYSMYKATFDDGKRIDLNVLNYNLYGQNTFNIAKGLTAELSGWFSGPGIWGGTFKTKSMGGFDIGLQKLVLQDKGTIKLGWTDVAKTMRWRAESRFAGVIFTGNGGWESNQFRINFSYRFGKSTVSGSRQRKTGAEDESKRIKSGGSSGPGGN